MLPDCRWRIPSARKLPLPVHRRMLPQPLCTLLEKSADRKAYLLGLLIDIGDLDINGIADLENIVRLFDLGDLRSGLCE